MLKAALRLMIALVLVGLALVSYKARSDLRFVFDRITSGEAGRFASVNPPLTSIAHIFDLGIVDADGDGHLDFFTSNHNYRQVLMLSDGKGGYQDVLTKWGLDQNHDFPGWEQSFVAPSLDRPGLYIYWLGESLTLRLIGMGDGVKVSGVLKMFSEISVKNAEGFSARTSTTTVTDSPIEQTMITFEGATDGVLELLPPSRGVPTQIVLNGDFPLDHVFLGAQKVSPKSSSFSPYLRDRHGLAWADVNGDGRLDVYISRGGVGGTIRTLPGFIRSEIRDEMLMSGGAPRFEDVAREGGINKKDCSGRHVRWTDIDGDGRLELFVNCQDRGRVEGRFPMQLWRMDESGHFEDVAETAGLGLVGHEIIDFIWMDVDGDGDLDLLTAEDTGFYVYENRNARFFERFLFRAGFARADVHGLRNEVGNYWRFDGKLTAADSDGDGDVDVFYSSKQGNLLLRGDGRSFHPVLPATLGLPEISLNAVWVDFDNDGLPDLHTVPDGLYRQVSKGRFEPTGYLTTMPHMYQAAIVQWFDMDNDGRRDALLASNENPGLWRWWQRPLKTVDDAHTWGLRMWRNLESRNHWLQVELTGPIGNPQGIGARVSVQTAQGMQTQDVGANDSSFFSQGHYRLYFGLGAAVKADKVTVRWSDGRTDELRTVAGDQRLRFPYGQTAP